MPRKKKRPSRPTRRRLTRKAKRQRTSRPEKRVPASRSRTVQLPSLNDIRDLTENLRTKLAGCLKLGILGIGSELRSDDAAGPLVCRELVKWNSNHPSKRLGIFMGDTAPENVTGEIRAFAPSHLIIVDVFEAGLRPGSVRFFESRNVAEGVSFSTHKMPVRVLTDFLEQTVGCRIVIIGIQAGSVAFSGKISEPVARAVKETALVIGRAAESLQASFPDSDSAGNPTEL